jgi:hypothetical protein
MTIGKIYTSSEIQNLANEFWNQFKSQICKSSQNSFGTSSPNLSGSFTYDNITYTISSGTTGSGSFTDNNNIFTYSVVSNIPNEYNINVNETSGNSGNLDFSC